jgi:cellulose synthase/poly-beta-1,6-N-acetylglucosamine synthase-like glycosyltransferase
VSSARSSETRTRAVGVVVPVHNEERRLGGTLAALEASLAEVEDRGLELCVAIVLDACDDHSTTIAKTWQRTCQGKAFEVLVVECDARNVGKARAIGCSAVLEAFGDADRSRIWLTTTDADSQVPPQWLGRQVDKHNDGVDVWAGRVVVVEWPQQRRHIASLWQANYDAERRPIHGASLGFNAEYYERAGGFPPLTSSEDRALYRELRARGAVIFHDSTARVATSARRRARAPEGFAAALTRIEESIAASAG